MLAWLTTLVGVVLWGQFQVSDLALCQDLELTMEDVRNPIAVAKLVLDASIQPLSLARVPPNLLVAEGAKDFAVSHGVDQLPDDFLVSEGARARWQNWRRDLLKAEAEEIKKNGRLTRQTATVQSAPASPFSDNDNSLSPPTSPQDPSQHLLLQKNISKHATADGPQLTYARDPHIWLEDDSESGTDDNLAVLAQARKRPRTDGSNDNDMSTEDSSEESLAAQSREALHIPYTMQEDMITDTVGAIAIDCFGRIAAGSSSGGIGMKHKGRCGPAALVGISTAVIPAHPDDPDEVAVATVTSGTGEHMATTAAAQTAADRILSCSRKSFGQLEPCTEDEAMYSMIKNDFMKHPGVQNSPCQGAIGVLSVKKTRQGIYFYFGHNTDSFAIASMHSDERKPVCVMSRSRESGLIAQGARKARARRAGKS